MPRVALSNVSLKQLIAEIEKRKGKLAELIVQRDKLDAQIDELQTMAGAEAAAPAGRIGRPPGRKAMVKGPRKPLGEYVKEVLAAAKQGLSVTEIERRILAGDYPTKAKRLYKQITAVLTRDGFDRIARGVYRLAGAARSAATEAVKAATKAMAKPPAAAKAAAKSKPASKPKARAKSKAAVRGTFPETSDQFVLGLVKGKGAVTSRINKAWIASGRKGVASPTLSNLFKAGKINRKPAKGEKGFAYTLA